MSRKSRFTVEQKRDFVEKTRTRTIANVALEAGVTSQTIFAWKRELKNESPSTETQSTND